MAFFDYANENLKQAIVSPGTKPTIRKGSTGEAVKNWQHFLKATTDPKLVVDGKFGSGTETATKTYQRNAGLTADGIVGPNTWATAEKRSTNARTAVMAPAKAATLTAVLLDAPQKKAAVSSGTKPTLRKGSTGEAVKEWQRFLKVTVDGIFGSGTETATKLFQKSQGLTQDGIVGPNTWAAAQKASAAPKPMSAPSQQAVIQAASTVSQMTDAQSKAQREAAGRAKAEGAARLAQAASAASAAAPSVTIRPPPATMTYGIIEEIMTPSPKPAAKPSSSTKAPAAAKATSAPLVVVEEKPGWMKIAGGAVGALALYVGYTGIKTLFKGKRAA